MWRISANQLLAQLIHKHNQQALHKVGLEQKGNPMAAIRRFIPTLHPPQADVTTISEYRRLNRTSITSKHHNTHSLLNNSHSKSNHNNRGHSRTNKRSSTRTHSSQERKQSSSLEEKQSSSGSSSRAHNSDDRRLNRSGMLAG